MSYGLPLPGPFLSLLEHQTSLQEYTTVLIIYLDIRVFDAETDPLKANILF